jgi:uncharacterized protein
MTISSPCISVCQMNPEVSLCDGCFRTLAEIAAWGSLSDPAKLAVLELVQERRFASDETLGASAQASDAHRP